MIKYVLKQNKNKKSLAFGKWYAFPVVEETVDLAKLAKHMEEHNTGFTEAVCLGMMTAMVARMLRLIILQSSAWASAIRWEPRVKQILLRLTILPV